MWDRPVVKALGAPKKPAALVDAELDELPVDIAESVTKAGDEAIVNDLDAEFPPVVLQTGSDIQFSTSSNEVISNRAIELVGGECGFKTPAHPNDHVSCG